MSPKVIMHDDVVAAWKTKSHDRAEIANHIVAKDSVKHEKTHRNSVASKKSEITLKGFGHDMQRCIDFITWYVAITAPYCD
jgi:hypothetical protein